MTSAQIIKALRSHHGWSQEKVGEQLGIDQATVSRIERGGAAAKPVEKLLERLAAEIPQKGRAA